MNFFGFGQSADVRIKLEETEKRRFVTGVVDGQEEKLPVYYDGEAVCGKIFVDLKYPGKKMEHHGIKVEFIGQFELLNDRGNPQEFTSVVRELEAPGEMSTSKTYDFRFDKAEKPYETYFGKSIRQRYFVRVTILKRMSNVVATKDIAVHTLSAYPEVNSSIKMEVGIEESLHIEFEYNKSKYHLKDVIVGKIYFLLVRIKIKHMELSIIKKEEGETKAEVFNSETLTKYEIMDGAPVRGESIPIRLFLAGFDLSPSLRPQHGKFKVKYLLNLVLIDDDDRRYFKQQEIVLWRKAPSSMARRVADGTRKLE